MGNEDPLCDYDNYNPRQLVQRAKKISWKTDRLTKIIYQPNNLKQKLRGLFFKIAGIYNEVWTCNCRAAKKCMKNRRL